MARDLEANWNRARAGEPLEESHRWIEEAHMDFLPTVIHAEYRGEYRIHLTFNDGSHGRD